MMIISSIISSVSLATDNYVKASFVSGRWKLVGVYLYFLCIYIMTKTIPQAFIRKYEPTCKLHLPDFWASALINQDYSYGHAVARDAENFIKVKLV